MNVIDKKNINIDQLKKDMCLIEKLIKSLKEAKSK